MRGKIRESVRGRDLDVTAEALRVGGTAGWGERSEGHGSDARHIRENPSGRPDCGG
ncbi:hypothetical protein F750_2390 [Streptomyces sp. PAMC 26508]|nr:hypothetical protein F750_2390 [Streptomyces sp. PAMC 26508]